MKRSNHDGITKSLRKCVGKTRLGLILAAALLLTGCGGTARGKPEPITVYLWSSELLNGYAQYIQSQLPNVDIQFVMGQNDLDCGMNGFISKPIDTEELLRALHQIFG